MLMLSSIFGAGHLASADLNITRTPDQKRTTEQLLVFSDGDDVKGVAAIQTRDSKQLEHGGVRLELIGKIEFEGIKRREDVFLSMSKNLDPAGRLTEPREYAWKFSAVELPHETYKGAHAKVRYLLRLTMTLKGKLTVLREVDFAVENATKTPPVSKPSKVDVGIEDCLHIDLTLQGNAFPLDGVVVGQVKFTVVRLHVQHMEIDIVRLETCGGPLSDGTTDSLALTSSNLTTRTTVVTKYEIMDGTPAKDETIPIRMSLRGIDLTPTYLNIQNTLSVRYFLNFILLDNDDRRYFKRQEIILYRGQYADPLEHSAFAT